MHRLLQPRDVIRTATGFLRYVAGGGIYSLASPRSSLAGKGRASRSVIRGLGGLLTIYPPALKTTPCTPSSPLPSLSLSIISRHVYSPSPVTIASKRSPESSRHFSCTAIG